MWPRVGVVASRKRGYWTKYMSIDTRITFLRELAIPFPANEPVESAKQALLNLTDLEWIEVCDWLQEINWLPS